MKTITIFLFLLVPTTLLVSGCNSVAFYGQAINGQMQLLTARQSISRLIDDPTTDPTLRQRLQTVAKMRAFASRDLALPDNASYKSYVKLNRPYVLWNIFAAPEFSLTAKQWCFPVAGCVSYRGYFSEKRANAYATKLRKAGFDTEVAGISAYSTLGWFSDPLLSSMMSRSDMALAGTLFHELAHQQLYVKNDTRFNESFAVAVELEGVRLWLKKQGEEKQYKDYLLRIKRKREFIALVQDTHKQLAKLYAQDISDAAKRDAKNSIFLQLKVDYKKLKRSWNNYRGYDTWFDRKLTNASLVPISSYNDYVPAFQALLKNNSNNLEAFYRDAHRIGKLAPIDRKAALVHLMGPNKPNT